MKTPRMPAFVLATIASLESNFRVMASVILVLLVLGFAPQSSLAQTVSVSPGDLSFGVPTGTPSPYASAQDSVTVTIVDTTTTTVAFQATAVGPTPLATDVPADFVIDGNSCTGTFTSTNTCSVTLHFNASQATNTTLETATLTINYTIDSAPGTLTIPLNGAYGAIKLFSALDVNSSLFSGVTWPATAGQAVKTANVILSCPASPTAVLSSTPDGLSNVFQDNTIQVTNTIGSVPTTTTNVCYGGDTNFEGFTGFPTGTTNCFTAPYEGAVSNYVGDNPDLATSPNPLLTTYGVQPLNLQTPPEGVLYGPVVVSGAQSLTVQLVDAGGDLGAATLHLATNCLYEGTTPGGSISGNPISSSDPSSLTQTYTFASGPSGNISITNGVAQNPPPSGTVPIVTDIAVPQQLFSQLTANTSAAPAVCFRLSSEVDVYGQPMCKGFLIQCYDPVGMTTSGNNCDPTPDAVRNLYNVAQFSSPDGPVNGHNYLYVPVGSPAADACSYYLKGVKGGACAALTGPGMLLGGDLWLTCELASCTSNPPVPPNTMTPASPATYSTANCALTGVLMGDLCPLDILTQFEGAADPKPGSTTTGINSVFVPVVNMPLPYAVAAIKNLNNGWVTTSSPQVAFVATPAIYVPLPNNPKANNFKPAPLYSVTFGTTPASSPLPDPTYQIPGDTILYTSYASQNFVSPLCPASTPAKLFSPTGSVSGLSNGSTYNLHFFATDCALSEGLVFLPQGSQLTNPTANWASFEYVTFGVDTTTPSLTLSPSASSGSSFKKGSAGPKVSFTCMTTGASGLQNCGTSLSSNLPATGYPTVGKDSTYARFDAVFLGLGLGATPAMGIPGEEWIVDGLEYIEGSKVNGEGMTVGRNVVVIGAGNTAIDCATVARRLGASNVTIVYRRSEREVSAYPHELDFIRREGVGFRFLAQPVRVIAESGRVTGLVCAEPAEGLEFVIPADQIVKAIGQEKPSLARTLGLEIQRGYIQVNADFETNIPGVFAGGDCIRSRNIASTVMAVQDGKLAAAAIHDRLVGQGYDLPAPGVTNG